MQLQAAISSTYTRLRSRLTIQQLSQYDADIAANFNLQKMMDDMYDFGRKETETEEEIYKAAIQREAEQSTPQKQRELHWTPKLLSGRKMRLSGVLAVPHVIQMERRCSPSLETKMPRL